MRRNADLFMQQADVDKNEIIGQSQYSFINELSSFIIAADSSLLSFAVFCCEIGICKHPRDILSQFFDEVVLLICNQYNGRETPIPMQDQERLQKLLNANSN